MLFEIFGKFINTVITKRKSDVGDTAIIASQHFFGATNTQIVNVCHRGNPINIKEQFPKIDGGNLAYFSQIFVADRLGEIVDDVVDGRQQTVFLRAWGVVGVVKMGFDGF